MAKKPATQNKVIKYMTSPLQLKAMGDALFIEGWANKAIVDSCGDFMVPSGAKMDRFEKNPIMLFNHDRDYPIGKVVEWKLDDEQGVWIKAEVSTSDDPKTTFVRNLIKQGILQTFSIGYNEQQAIKQSDGSRKVTEWELHEVSAVTIPMNDASTFSLSKSLAEKDFKTAMEIITKSIDEQPVAEVPQEQAPETAKAVSEPASDTPADQPSPDANNEPANEPNEDDAKATAFQECVTAKIPKLIDEGKPQEQAVAIAISMCREEGKCSIEPTEKQWADFIAVAETKQASMVPAETQAIQDETPPVKNDLMDRLDKLIEINMEVSAKMSAMLALMQADKEPEEEPVEPVVPSEEVPAVSESSSEDVEAKASRLAKVKAMFDNFDSTLKALGV